MEQINKKYKIIKEISKIKNLSKVFLKFLRSSNIWPGNKKEIEYLLGKLFESELGLSKVNVEVDEINVFKLKPEVGKTERLIGYEGNFKVFVDDIYKYKGLFTYYYDTLWEDFANAILEVEPAITVEQKLSNQFEKLLESWRKATEKEIEKLDRCVEKVKKKSNIDSPWAVCLKSLKMKKGKGGTWLKKVGENLEKHREKRIPKIGKYSYRKLLERTGD